MFQGNNFLVRKDLMVDHETGNLTVTGSRPMPALAFIDICHLSDQQ